MRNIRTLSIFLIFILLSLTTFLHAATEQRIALVIGNSSYEASPLRNPVNDATDIAVSLKNLGFTVILRTNATKIDMGEAVEDFGKRLEGVDVVLFYYAGHGVQVNQVNYLIPVGAKISEETDVEHEAIAVWRVLATMNNAKSRVNIVILDACRENPYLQGFRSATKGLAVISKVPPRTIISYSTGPGYVAIDGKERNSPYTAALLQYMNKPGLTVEDVFKEVRHKLSNETGQIPWEQSALEGDFFFVPGEAGKAVGLVQTEAVAPTVTSTVVETGKDGPFIAYSDGTVLDKRTNLMWAAKDNGVSINWQDANRYCETYRGGGYNNWRMPTQDELAKLYDASYKGYAQDCGSQYDWVKLTNLIHISCCCPWAWQTRGSMAAKFNFKDGFGGWLNQSENNYYRALPVRNAK